ncbi:MAG: FHA domain-containing protein [Gemmataceae bacterium]|nr:FHA domain-containing protein [Gemmataceae bacterium]
MALFSRVYFNAVFGALGGLLGWMLFGAFADPHTSDNRQWLFGGALIGASIGYFVVSVEAIRDRSLVRFCHLASYGVVLGAVGGAIGMWVGEKVNFQLVGAIGRREGTMPLLATMLARGLGWMFLGLAVGVSEGIAARSLGKLSYGTLGGTLGGFIGGAVFGWLYLSAIEQSPNTSDLWGILGGAVGLIILGASIGALSALVQGVFQPASVRVVRGWQEGREYPLVKNQNLLGRDELADVALFRDMKIEKRHAYIRRERNSFILVNNDAPAEQTQVNGEPVRVSHDLEDGDRIQLGGVVLRFQRRAAQARKRKH